jgi:acyl-CoA thioesterase-1
MIGVLKAVWALAVVAVCGIAPAWAQAQPIRIVALGDSLTAGYQLAPSAAFPNVLERALKAKGYNVRIENAGVSGDTASGGRDRLDWAVPDGTDAVILELGANDMLRGLDPAITRNALDEIITRLKARNIQVLLAGMVASANLGPEYARSFNAIYPDLARKHGLILYPFFLDGVAADASLNLADRIHPNRRGVEVIVERMLPTVERFVRGLKVAG